MLKKIYFYTQKDLTPAYTPFRKLNLNTAITGTLGVENLNQYQIPSDWTSKASVYNELYSLVIGRFYQYAIVKIVKSPYESEPTEAEIRPHVIDFFMKLLSIINDTHDYYMTMLDNYAAAKDELMADIKATSKNKVKFNDTPQNPNGATGVYEGDDYITHFTSTEGENSSPLMSKIMRLKEIQDNYKDLMSIWVNDFRKLFYEESKVAEYD